MDPSHRSGRWFRQRDRPAPPGPGAAHPGTLITWTIEESGKARLEVERELLFAAVPPADDLRDVVFGSETLDFEGLDYQSPDADVTDVIQGSGHMVQVVWKPRDGGPRAGVSYRHAYRCELPDVLSPEFKNFTIECATPIARFTLRIVSRRPVQDVICYRARPDQDVGDAEEIYRRAKEVRRRGAPPPRKVDPQTYEVTIAPLQPGDRYFVVLRFAGPLPGHVRPRLVVVVPGLGPAGGWEPLVRRLRREEALVDTAFRTLDHRKRWHSLGRAEQLAREVRAHIDETWKANGPYADVVLVGHSMGALLVRRAYMMACGADGDAAAPSPWAERVSRLILFAGINRGVDPEKSLLLRPGAWGCRALPFLRGFLFWDLLRGSDFVTNLRIQWIRHFASLGDQEPVVVQILGTRDGIVRRDDSIDVEQFPNACLMEVAEATHDDVFRLEGVPDPDTRYAYLRDAFVHQRPQRAINRAVKGPKEVVFVLHGIRADNRTWVQQTIEAIRRQWPDVQAIGPRYEYFTALRFAIPMTRRRNLQWFRDAYTEALARNPEATFSFIGHSNGTYIFGESLRAIPGMRFARAVLVGSVLPVDYDWETCAKRGQLERLRVDGSARDWPVGWLCSFLRGAGMRDVGTGGFEGFTRMDGVEKSEHFWYDGGHSAPLASANLPALAAFAVEGRDLPPTIGAQPGWFGVVSRALRRLARPAIALLLLVFGYLTWTSWIAGLVVLLAFLAVVVVLDVI